MPNRRADEPDHAERRRLRPSCTCPTVTPSPRPPRSWRRRSPPPSPARPIPEAFRQQGITIPAPGTAVAAPGRSGPARSPATSACSTDRHALALGNGKAVFDKQIQPIASVTGPSFLGWEHPPEPGSSTTHPPSRTVPTPTRPAVTAGPS